MGITRHWVANRAEVDNMKRLLAALLTLAAPTAFAVDATEVGSAVKRKTEDIKYKAQETFSSESGGSATQYPGTFKEDKAYKLKGTVELAGPRQISIAREGLPPVVLEVRDKSMIKLDGQMAKSEELPRGAEVNGRFQLEGDNPVAVKLEAKSKGLRRGSVGTGGSGKAGSSQQQEQSSKETKQQ
jgi:hypothetical protein